MKIKEIIRKNLNFFHLDLTKNLEYDRLTKKIMKDKLSDQSNCIDVGCHKGEILDLMLKYSPSGNHYAFEPIPYLFNDLINRYGEKAEIFSYALSDVEGSTVFQLVKNAPAYSGIKKRRYDIDNPDIEEINVELGVLDNIIPVSQKIDFIKIDVEGGEFAVLKGAKRIIKKDKPIIVFECGKGASDYYGTTAEDIYNFMTNELTLKISTLKSFIKSQESLNLLEFKEYFENNKEYYFVASN